MPEEGMLLSISLDSWIDLYTSDPNAALVELANFLAVHASGLEKVQLLLSGGTGGDGAGDEEREEDPLDDILTETNCMHLWETARDNGTRAHPSTYHPRLPPSPIALTHHPCSALERGVELSLLRPSMYGRYLPRALPAR